MKIKAIFKKPNHNAEVIMIEDDCSELSNLCDGIIDIIQFPSDENIEIACNDEFLINGMQPNIVIPKNGEVLCGPLLFITGNNKNGTLNSLTDKQIKTVLSYVEKNQVHNMNLKQAIYYAAALKIINRE